MHFLTVQQKGAAPFTYDLRAPRTRVGRSSRNDLVLNDLTVSRAHAVLELVQGHHRIKDLGSQYGTRVNHCLITRHTPLRPGDLIELGQSRLIYDSPGPVQLKLDEVSTGQVAARVRVDDEVWSSPPGLEGTSAPQESAILALLLEADRELGLNTALERVCDKILELASRVLPYERGLLMLKEGESLRPAASRLPPDEVAAEVRLSRAILDMVLRGGEAVLIRDVAEDKRAWQRQSLVSQRIRSVIAVPLKVSQSTLGLLYLDSRHEIGQFNNQSLRLLVHLGNIAAFKIENRRLLDQTLTAEVLNRQLEQAAEIQARLLPRRAADIPGFALHAYTDPCFAVGGDCYDFSSLTNGQHNFVVADVAGKGLPAALLACSLLSSLRTMVDLALPLQDIMARLNRLLCQQLPANRFIALFCGFLDPRTSTLSYANAGLCLPLLIRRQGGIHELALGGTPLGILEEAVYQTHQLRMERGDVLLCFSDGATDITTPADESFGRQRLGDAALASRNEPVAELVRSLAEAIQRHRGDSPADDDITLLALKRM